jgi:hypothetical protein
MESVYDTVLHSVNAQLRCERGHNTDSSTDIKKSRNFRRLRKRQHFYSAYRILQGVAQAVLELVINAVRLKDIWQKSV